MELYKVVDITFDIPPGEEAAFAFIDAADDLLHALRLCCTDDIQGSGALSSTSPGRGQISVFEGHFERIDGLMRWVRDRGYPNVRVEVNYI